MINLGLLAPLVVSVLKGRLEVRLHGVVGLLRRDAPPRGVRVPEPARRRARSSCARCWPGRPRCWRRPVMLMVVVYSVFWILYFQTFGSALWYLRDVVDKSR